MADAWIANVSDGRTVVERWVSGEPAPWERLMALCKENSLWVTNLRMTICSETISLPSHAEGYWQVCKRVAVETLPPEKLPVVRGIGNVTGDVLHIFWGVRTEKNTAYFWEEISTVNGQHGIIWSPK